MLYTIIGSDGYIGRHIKARLIKNNIPYKELKKNEIVSDSDLGIIFYCAGITADFRSRPHDTVRAHVNYLSDVLYNCKYEKLIYLSSTRVYVTAEHGHEDAEIKYKPPESYDLYNLSKLLGEALCFQFPKNKTVIARLSNVIGGENYHSDDFLYAITKEAISGNIHLRTSLESAKDYICINDVIDILFRLTSDTNHQIYNVASGKKFTNEKIVNFISTLLSFNLVVDESSPNIFFPELDVSRIKNEFQYAASSIFDELEKLILLMKEKHESCR